MTRSGLSVFVYRISSHPVIFLSYVYSVRNNVRPDTELCIFKGVGAISTPRQPTLSSKQRYWKLTREYYTSYKLAHLVPRPTLYYNLTKISAVATQKLLFSTVSSPSMEKESERRRRLFSTERVKLTCIAVGEHGPCLCVGVVNKYCEI